MSDLKSHPHDERIEKLACDRGLDVFKAIEHGPLLTPAFVAEAKKTGIEEGAQAERALWVSEMGEVRAEVKSVNDCGIGLDGCAQCFHKISVALKKLESMGVK